MLLGNGDGTFARESRYLQSGGKKCSEAETSDLDGDGDVDLVVSNCDGRDVSVLLNNGDGTFADATDYVRGTRCPDGLTVADLNGDNIPDLAVGNNTGDILILMGNGDGTFGGSETYDVTDQWVPSLVSGDVDADGDLDLLMHSGGWGFNTVFLLLNYGDGTFGEPIHYEATTDLFGLTVADLDTDGDLDIVASGAAVSVLLGRGDGTFETAVDYAVTSDNATSPTVADWNADGFLDVAVTNRFANRVTLFAGRGDGTFSDPATLRTSNWPSDMVAGDYNNDGLSDLAVTSSGTDRVLVFLNALELPQPVTADFNGDEVIDVDDVDALMAQIAAGTHESSFDLTADGQVDAEDLNEWLAIAASANLPPGATYFAGDANLDGLFDSSDLVQVFQRGEYEDDADGNSEWSTGDWDADGDFTSSDLVAAFQTGRYEIQMQTGAAKLAAAVEWLYAEKHGR